MKIYSKQGAENPLGGNIYWGVRKLRLDLVTRKRITQEVAKRYKKASKKEKGRILDEFCALTGYNRSYAAGVLRKVLLRRKKPGVFRQAKFPVFSK